MIKNTQHNQKRWLWTMLISLFLLVVIGLVFVFEASLVESAQTFDNPFQMFERQLTGIALGLIAFVLGIIIPYRFWQKLAPFCFVVAISLLICVFLPKIGLELNGARRWISVMGFNFQPVEFFKFSLILFFANWLPKHQKLTSFLLSILIPSLLIALQPDLGSLLLVLAVSFSMFFYAGGNIKQILILFLIGFPIILLLIVLSPYRFQRLTTFLNPNSDPLGASFHIHQIVVALGRGGWLGQGIGNSKQKYYYIPEASTDSIFAIVGEELGFVGSLVLIILIVIFIFSAYHLVTNPAISVSMQLFGLGITTWIAIQSVLNLAAVVSLVPLTGVPLPFFSYGRSAQIMLLLAAGCILKIGKEYEISNRRRPSHTGFGLNRLHSNS